MGQLQALEASIIDHNIKLVLVDSIAALARSEFSQEKVMDRQQMLGKIICTGSCVFSARVRSVDCDVFGGL